MRTEAIKISVIIPVYNGGSYLRECVESLINQTYRNLELIFVDDGSTDGSDKVLEEYKSHPLCRIFHKENGGVQSARRFAMGKVTGDYVTFADADDIVAPNAYAEYSKAIEKFHPDLRQFRYRDVYGNRPEPLPVDDSPATYLNLRDGEIADVFMDMEKVTGMLWDKVWKRELLEKIDFQNRFLISSDAVYVWDSLKYVASAVIIEKVLYSYRVLQDSLFHSRSVRKNMTGIDAWDYILQDAEGMRLSSLPKIYLNKLRFVLMAAESVAQSREPNRENIRIIRQNLKAVYAYRKDMRLRYRVESVSLRYSWPLFVCVCAVTCKIRRIISAVRSAKYQ